MNKQCRILWLDDDFSTESTNYKAMSAHLRHVEDAFKNKGLVKPEIVTKVYVDEFLAEAKERINYWDVFIVDINGFDKVDERFKDPQDRMHKICRETKSCDVLRFCLTGQTHLSPNGNYDINTLSGVLEDCHFVPDDEVHKKPYWWKADSVSRMAKKIVELYDDEFGGYYLLRELCLYMNEADKDCIRRLAKWKKTGGREPFPDHGALRTALKDGVLQKALPNMFFCGEPHNFKFFEEKVDSKLKDSAIADWQRFPIAFLTVLNKECHSNSKIENPQLNEMIFNAVMIFADWLVGFLEKGNKNPLNHYVELPASSTIVENSNSDQSSSRLMTNTSVKDKIWIEKHYQRIGDCEISPKVMARCINSISSSVEVVEKTDNTDPDKKCICPYYATKISLKLKDKPYQK